MTIRYVLFVTALVALAAAMAGVVGCGPQIVPTDTDIFFVGVSASQQELTVSPGTRIELGVYRVMSNGGIALTTRNTEVDYHVSPMELDGRQTGVVEAGVLVAYYGTFLVSAVDNSQFFHDAQPLVVHVSDGAPVTPTGGQVTIDMSTDVFVVGGRPYTIIIPNGVVINWGQIPLGGINVFWVNSDTIVGNITVVNNNTLQVIFIQSGLDEIAATIPIGTVMPVTVSFVINNVTYTLVVYILGTQTVTPPANQPPVARFTVSPTSGAPGRFDFDGSSSNDPDGRIVRYLWNIDGNVLDDGARVGTVFNTTGNKVVSLTVYDDDGATATLAVTVSVSQSGVDANLPPTLQVVFDPLLLTGVAPLLVTMTATVSDPDGDSVTVTTNWGDGGTTSFGTNVSHTYSVAGTFTVTVVATDSRGATTTFYATVVVSSPPPGGGVTYTIE